MSRPSLNPEGDSMSNLCKEKTREFDTHAENDGIVFIIYSNKKETSDFHGTVLFDPVKMSQQKIN